jgi:hypothetical protein
VRDHIVADPAAVHAKDDSMLGDWYVALHFLFSF